MASGRMFNRNFIQSEDFINLRPLSQVLYFNLCLAADDDGIVNNAKSTTRQIGAKPQNVRELTSNGFVLELTPKLHAITHWRVNNHIRKDRYTPSKHLEALKMLGLRDDTYFIIDDKVGIPDGSCSMYEIVTKNSKDKNSKDKNSKDKNSKDDTGTQAVPYQEIFNNYFYPKLKKTYPSNRLNEDYDFSAYKKTIKAIMDGYRIGEEDASAALGRAVWEYVHGFNKENLQYVCNFSKLISLDGDGKYSELLDEKVKECIKERGGSNNE